MLVKGGWLEKSQLGPKEVTWDWMRELASGEVRPEEVRERRERWIHCFRGKKFKWESEEGCWGTGWWTGWW